MRFLFVLPEYPPRPSGGIGTFYRAWLPGLAEGGHQVSVIAGSAFVQDDAHHETDGVAVRYLPPTRFREQRARLRKLDIFPELRDHLAASWALWEHAERGDGFDVVETADWGLAFVPWVLAESGPVAAVELHGSVGQIDAVDLRQGYELQGDLIRMIETMLLRYADLCCAHSDRERAEWMARLDREVSCIRPALNPPPQASPPTPTRSATALRGIVVGRVQLGKGAEVLCAAMRRLGSEAPEITWVGRDTESGRRGGSVVADLSRQFPDVWGRRIRHVHEQTPSGLSRWQSEADFGVVPSVWDSFNLACVELMALGKPVICSTGAGVAELIRDGENGLLVPAGDPVALGDRLRDMLRLSPESRTQMGEKARATVCEQLDPAAVLRERLRMYSAALDAGRRDRPPMDWLHHFLSPAAGGEGISAILDRIPARTLARHLLGRLRARVL